MGGQMKMVVISVVVVLATGVANAKASCEPLVKDLRAMQAAQASLLKSLTQKNESMAKTLDQFSRNFEDLAKEKKTLHRKDIVGLKISAKAFREHGTREDQLIQRFETATSELFSQVESCLNNETVAQAKN